MQAAGCLDDDRLALGEWGPFDNHAPLHDFLDPKAAHFYLLVLSTVTYSTVSAHGDLGPHNDLWKNGRIIVIDRERG